MGYRVAINGFGRIGRNYLRAVLGRGLLGKEIDIVGINDLWDPATLAQLVAYDSTFGPLTVEVTHDDAAIDVGGYHIPTSSQKDPSLLGWGELAVDLVI